MDILLQRIHETFPELTWTAARYDDSGWDHQVVILDEKLVFRFSHDPQYIAMLANEINILSELKPLVAMSIPDYRYVAADKSFAGYEMVPGQELAPELYNSLNLINQDSIARQLGEFLTTLHTTFTESGSLSQVLTTVMADDQTETKQDVAKYLPTVLDEAELRLVDEIMNEVDILVANPVPNVFLHGDVYSRHLLWDTTAGKIGIIDFSDMNIGDPAVDFAELYEYGKGFVEMVYEQYDGSKDDSFLARAWAYQRWVGVYMMTDYFINHKTSFAVARETFDRVRHGL